MYKQIFFDQTEEDDDKVECRREGELDELAGLRISDWRLRIECKRRHPRRLYGKMKNGNVNTMTLTKSVLAKQLSSYLNHELSKEKLIA